MVLLIVVGNGFVLGFAAKVHWAGHPLDERNLFVGQAMLDDLSHAGAWECSARRSSVPFHSVPWINSNQPRLPKVNTCARIAPMFRPVYIAPFHESQTIQQAFRMAGLQQRNDPGGCE